MFSYLRTFKEKKKEQAATTAEALVKQDRCKTDA